MEDQFGSGIGGWITVLLVVVTFASMWKVFAKAGQPGWASLIPIYNTIVMLKIAGKQAWWFVLLLVPVVNIVVLCIVMNAIAKSFGGGTGYTLGLLFLGWIFFALLGFGDAEYQGTPA